MRRAARTSVRLAVRGRGHQEGAPKIVLTPSVTKRRHGAASRLRRRRACLRSCTTFSTSWALRRLISFEDHDMKRKTAHDFDQDLLILFDAYVHGIIDRRSFLDQAKKFAVGGVTAAMLLDQLSPKFAEAQQVPRDDARLAPEYVEFDSPNGYGKARGYLATPAKAEKKLPAILVIHENRGLNPHIEDVARRFALENFVAFAPDALFPLGGYPGDEDKAHELFPKLDQSKTREDFVAA